MVASKPVGKTLAVCKRKGGFLEKLCAYNERKRVNLKFCHVDFIYLIQELCGNCFI